jgi:hypothetical protein
VILLPGEDKSRKTQIECYSDVQTVVWNERTLLHRGGPENMLSASDERDPQNEGRSTIALRHTIEGSAKSGSR